MHPAGLFLHEFEKKLLTTLLSAGIITHVVRDDIDYGGLAQLGERLHGMQEVSGSIPLFSTKKKDTAQFVQCLSFCTFVSPA